MKDQNESGRSMVEMLGVLAIIGVLSVMGIAGFKSAMTKHRANTLFDEMMKRAVSVAGQLSFGAETATLTGFSTESESYGSFLSTVEQNGNQFTLSITNVSDAICEQAKALVEAGGVVQGFNPTTCSGDNNTVKFTYNNDLSFTPSAGGAGSSGSNGGSTHAPTEWDGPTADDGSICTGERKGECQVCMNGAYIDSDAICIAQGKGVCIDSVCKSTIGCMSNGDCVAERMDNQGNLCTRNSCYCNFSSGVDASSGPTAGGSCWAKSYSLRSIVVVDGHEYVLAKHGPSMNWWSAKNFCASYGKRMMHFSELGCQINVNCKQSNTLMKSISEAVGADLDLGWMLDLATESNAYYITHGGQVRNYNRDDGIAPVLCY